MNSFLKKIAIFASMIVLYFVLLGRAKLIFGGEYFSDKNVIIALAVYVGIIVICFVVYESNKHRDK